MADDKKGKGADTSLKGSLLSRLEITSHFPSIRLSSWVLFISALGIYFLLPFLGTLKTSWSSGPLANKHHMIAADCGSCHGKPFQTVPDNKCISCHRLTDHSEVLSMRVSEKPELHTRCASCHMDHNGDGGLIARQPSLCTDCHAKIKSIAPDSTSANVANFDLHPEFSVALAIAKTEMGAEQKFKHVRLDDKANLIDPTHIKLNHKIHLTPDIRRSDGAKETLGCKDCHHLKPDFRTFEPIGFDRDCRRCHSLEFDERLPGNQVPHGDTDLVYNYMYAEYAKYFLAVQEEAAAEQGFVRFRPGQEVQPAEKTEYVRKYVRAETRAAEQILYTRTACQLCHDVTKKEDSTGDISTGELSAFEILSPAIPEVWLPRSIFGHGAHEELKCESCHEGVPKSEQTSDVLIPGVSTCRTCHAQVPHVGQVRSECIECHSYHDSLEMKPEKKLELKEIVRRSE